MPMSLKILELQVVVACVGCKHSGHLRSTKLEPEDTKNCYAVHKHMFNKAAHSVMELTALAMSGWTEWQLFYGLQNFC